MSNMKTEEKKQGGKRLPAPDLNGPLYPFEQDQLKRLIQQVEASPARVRSAFFAHFNRVSA